MANKSRDDFSEAELKKFHGQLSKAVTKEDRAVIFKQMNAMPQAVGQWFRHMKLEPLGAIGTKGDSTPKKRGRPAGDKSTPKAKPGRPKATAPKATSVKSSSSGMGISREAKETLIRLLDKLIND